MLRYAATFIIWLCCSPTRRTVAIAFNQHPEESNSALIWHVCFHRLRRATPALHLVLHSSPEPYLSHVYEKDLLIIGQGMPGSTQPRNDNPIRWEDPGRRYGHNGMETGLPRSKTHFLMHNKAFILFAVTRKEGASWELKVQRLLYSCSDTWFYGASVINTPPMNNHN